MSEHLHTDHEDGEDAARTPTPFTGAGATSPTLDALLSPKNPEAHFPARASVAASDVTDDETRFSTVALSSAHQSWDSARLSLGSADSNFTKDDRRNTVALDTAGVSTPVKALGHKKTPSTSTILSASNVPFMLSQMEGDESSRRNSAASQHKIQEEFARKHVDLQDSGSENDEEDSVDWDFWGQVVSVARLPEIRR